MLHNTQVSGTKPLWPYWHNGRADNFSAASAEGIAAAENAGYNRIRIEGYVVPF